jgi:glutamate:Na+ symporter, ESS family
MFLVLALQGLAVALYASIITFRVMGSNYEAAVPVAGQCGFGLGAATTAITNIQAVCARYGAAPQAFIIIPVAGALLIDLANAVVISGFVYLMPILRG